MRKRKRDYVYQSCLFILSAVLFLSMNNKVYAKRAASDGGQSSDNQSNENYSVRSFCIQSYLFENENGRMTRVEKVENSIIVETYDSAFHCIDSKQIPMELDLFGGFYAGKDGYYFVFGQANPREDSTVEVYRVVKYSKDWKRIASCGLTDCNTTEPFGAGSLRFAESGNILYIRTCHIMYKSRDGLNHQANLMISVDKENMLITDSLSKVSNIHYGYVSHSFNQFILTNGEELVAVDHGDAYPRSVVLIKYSKKAGEYTFSDVCNFIDLLVFPGEIGENSTGGSVGGFEAGSDNYLVAGNYANKTECNRNIYVSITSQQNFSEEGSRLVYLTDYTGDVISGTPQLVKINGNRFLVLWETWDAGGGEKTVRYVFVDQNGNKLSDIQSMHGNVSDCKPMVSGENVVWYYTDDSTPVFCMIPCDGSSTEDNLVQGEIYTVDNVRYKILKSTESEKQVTVERPDDCFVESVTIPDSVNLNGEKYLVTEISANAFSLCDDLKKLTIGRNVQKIGQKMTAGVDSVSTIIIKSEKLESVGKAAFEGMYDGKIKVSKKRLKQYKKLLAKKGQGSSVKIVGM